MTGRGRRVRIAFRTLGVFLLLGGAAACDSLGEGPPQSPQAVRWASSLGIQVDDFQRVDGVWVRDDVVGTGPRPTVGQFLSVQYRGWLPNGLLFDSSVGRAPLQFNLGRGQLIPGFELAAAGMNVGGTRWVLIPPELGYGPRGAGVIPGNSWLVFEIQLISAAN
jgi:FKBP-type peptidyl-prolyl cis-trans isomerase FkpA